jgi:hypothetical protein
MDLLLGFFPCLRGLEHEARKNAVAQRLISAYSGQIIEAAAADNTAFSEPHLTDSAHLVAWHDGGEIHSLQSLMCA